MQVFWCKKCKVPVMYSSNINKEDAKSNQYIDIEDKLIDWIHNDNLDNYYYTRFLALKKRINNSFKNDNTEKIEKELKNQKKSTDNNNKKLIYFALKYLDLKKNKRKSKKIKQYTCPKCGSVVEYMAKDIRPVFMEERILLSVLLGEDFKNHNIWNGVGNRYIVDGQACDFNLSNLYHTYNLSKKIKIINHKIKSNINKVDFSAFIEVNKNHFNYIEHTAISFIKKIAKIFNERLQVVSFSGGKDSTLVSDLIRRALNTQDILHVFGDTTLEYPFTYDYINRFKKKPKRPPFLPVDKPDKSFMELSEQLGPPSRVMNWCCTIFKTGPIGNLFRQIADEQKILTWYGIRRSESKSRSNYDKITKSPKIAKQLVVSPIIDWYDVDVWLYLLTRSIDFNDAYKLGFSRVGCWCCPNNSRFDEFLSKIFMNEKEENWRKFLVDFAKKIGKPDPNVYIETGKWKARQGGRGLAYSEVAVTLESNPCALEDMSKNYNLSKPITKDLYEFFKPFGEINYDIGDKNLGEVYILDPKDSYPWFILQGNEGSNQLKVKIVKDYRVELLFKRIECQIRKYQSCIKCTACANICPNDAISLINGYHIDEDKCNHCMKCVAYYHKGCIVTKAMMDY